MGSGLSLNDNQVAFIIERDMKKHLNYEQSIRPRFTDDGYEIFYDFSDEVNLKKKIKKYQEWIKKNPHVVEEFYFNSFKK